MPVTLYLAPAGAGKTTYVLDQARSAAAALRDTPLIIVPSALQVIAARRRLASGSGTLGVTVGTFDDLLRRLLALGRVHHTYLDDHVTYRLVRVLLAQHPLEHYAAIRALPGFARIIQDLLAALQMALIEPAEFRQAIASMGNEPRLRELAEIYGAYVESLAAWQWIDRSGMGKAALGTLLNEANAPPLPWSLVLVDGFQSFTCAQRAVLRGLADRTERLVITLTGEAGSAAAHPAHELFAQTRQELEHDLGVSAQPLPPVKAPERAPALGFLETHLFSRKRRQPMKADNVSLYEAPDRRAEARYALRWIKRLLVTEGMAPREVALLARNLEPYRPHILQTAEEFGLPVYLLQGRPLVQNPLIATLFRLLRLALPAADGETQPALPRRDVLTCLRSPYFHWDQILVDEDAAGDAQQQTTLTITAEDVERLEAVARWGRVIGGLDQWLEALESLTPFRDEELLDDERGLPQELPRGVAAQQLLQKFHQFVRFVRPPSHEQSYRRHVRWLERLLGPAVEGELDPASLNIFAAAREAGAAQYERDMAALDALKKILRSLVWAEESLGASDPVTFTHFLRELTAAVDSASFEVMPSGADAVLVTGVGGARGLSFRAVAIIGMGEGEFPAPVVEDVLLRESDRQQLQEAFDLPLQSSVTSYERQFFYDAVTSARDRLLLTRPRMADNGAPWPPSLFWDEVRRLTDAAVVTGHSSDVPEPEASASWSELVESLAAYAEPHAAESWLRSHHPRRWAHLQRAASILSVRYQTPTDSSFDGQLMHLGEQLAIAFGPAYNWSPSQLELYRQCAFAFFVSRALGVQAREEPEEGLDARQLGTIYHRIFERLFQFVPHEQRRDLAALNAALPGVADAVLDDAPQREGFRADALWEQTRARIKADVQRSLIAMEELDPDFTPSLFEVRFGGANALQLRDGDDSIRVRGIIDRVDVDGARRRLRVIDYKTAGPSRYTPSSLTNGENLQLPLYALAASRVFDMEIADGFYWHVRDASASDLRLAKYGVDEALAAGIRHAWEAVHAVRDGDFVPRPPRGGCPGYCPAVAFCWRYQPRSSW